MTRVDLSERQPFSSRPGFGLKKHLASRFALCLAYKQGERAVGLGRAALGSVRPGASFRSLLFPPSVCAGTEGLDFAHVK